MRLNQLKVGEKQVVGIFTFEKREHDWLVYFTDFPKIWEFGKDPTQALGKLCMSQIECLGIVVVKGE